MFRVVIAAMIAAILLVSEEGVRARLRHSVSNESNIGSTIISSPMYARHVNFLPIAPPAFSIAQAF